MVEPLVFPTCEEEPTAVPQLLTGPDVARILQISEPQAYRLMQRGAIRVVRFGRCVRVRPAALDAFIREREGR